MQYYHTQNIFTGFASASYVENGLEVFGQNKQFGDMAPTILNVVGRSLFSQHGVVFIYHTPPCVSLGGGLEFTLPRGAPGQQWDPGLH